MNWKRLLRRGLLTLAVLLLLVVLLLGSLWWYLHPTVRRTNGIAYGQRGDKTLALDVLKPGTPNGLGVLVLVSGGWKSKGAGEFPVWMAAPLLRRGYTVFAVYHVSQPKATVMEIVEDMHRAVRFVRHHAGKHGVDPQRLGVTGGSAGGHLSLMLSTRGGPGRADAVDPVDRESSAVQAVAIFFPVTDLLNLGKSTENPGDGARQKVSLKHSARSPRTLPCGKSSVGTLRRSTTSTPIFRRSLSITAMPTRSRRSNSPSGFAMPRASQVTT